MSLGDIRIEYFEIDSHVEMSRISANSVIEKSQHLIQGKQPNFILFLNDGSTLAIHVELLIEYSYRFIELLKSGQLFDISGYNANAIRMLISFLYNGYITIHLDDISYLLHLAGRIKLRICCEVFSQYLAQMSARSLNHALCCAEIISISGLYFCAEYSAKMRINIVDVIEHANSLNILYETISIGGIKEILFALQIYANEKRTRLALTIANSWLQARNERFNYAGFIYALVPLKILSIQELIEISETLKQQLIDEIYIALLRQLKEVIYNKDLGADIRNVNSTLTFESQTSLREAQPSPEVFDEILLPDGISKSLSANVCPEETINANTKEKHPSMSRISSVNISKDSGSSSSISGNSIHHRQILTATNGMSPEALVYPDTNFNQCAGQTPQKNRLTGVPLIEENGSKNTKQKSKIDQKLDQMALAYLSDPTSAKKQIGRSDFKVSETHYQKVENLRPFDVIQPGNLCPPRTIQTVKHNDLSNTAPPYRNMEKPGITNSAQPNTLVSSAKGGVIKHDNSMDNRRQCRKYGNFGEALNVGEPNDPVISIGDDKSPGKNSLVESFREKAGGSNENGFNSIRFNHPPIGNARSLSDDGFNQILSHNTSDLSDHNTDYPEDVAIQENFENNAGKFETLQSVKATNSSSTNRKNNANIWKTSSKEKQLPIICSTAIQISFNDDSLTSNETKIKQSNFTSNKARLSSESLNRIQNTSSISTIDANEKDTSTARSPCSIDEVIRSAISASYRDRLSKPKHLTADKKSIKTFALPNSRSCEQSSLIDGNVELVGISQEWQRQPSGGKVQVTSASVVRYAENSNASSSASLSSLQLANSTTNMKYDLESSNKSNEETVKHRQSESNIKEYLKQGYGISRNDKIGTAKFGAREFDLKTAIENRKTSTIEQNIEDDLNTAKEIQRVNRKNKSSHGYSSSSSYKSISYGETSSLCESENTSKSSISKQRKNDAKNDLKISDQESDQSLKTVPTTSSFIGSDHEKTSSSSFSL